MHFLLPFMIHQLGVDSFIDYMRVFHQNEFASFAKKVLKDQPNVLQLPTDLQLKTRLHL